MIFKVEIPKPKFDVGDLVAFKFEQTETRSDDVPLVREVKGAGVVQLVDICKDQNGWTVGYIVEGNALVEGQMKLIVI